MILVEKKRHSLTPTIGANCPVEAIERYEAELLAAANEACEVNSRKSPALTILKRKTG